MLSRKTETTYIDPSEAAHYNDNNVVQFAMVQDFIDANARHICASVLDIGSGDGRVSAYIAKNIAQPITGVDISLDRVRYANEHYGSKRLRFFRCNAARLKNCRPVSRKRYNTVVSFN